MGADFSTSLPTSFICWDFFGGAGWGYSSHFNEYEVESFYTFGGYSVMIRDIDHLFTLLVAICNFSGTTLGFEAARGLIPQ